MARSTGTMKLSSNFEPRLGAPLDARIVVPTVADLTASGNFPYPYVGMVVAVQATSELYVYGGGGTTTLTNWKKVGNENPISGDVGDSKTPIYLNDGTFTALDYTIEKSVPSDAKFTDTTYESKNASESGTDVSLVTTGEKYAWNNKSDFSGNYNDLTNKPTIPSAANNGTLTITQNGTSKGTFSANQSTNKTIEVSDTTYESKSAASGGTDVSLVTTGEKYTWNNKSNLALGTTHTTAAYGDHNHDGTYLKSVPAADTDTLGGIKTGFTTSGNNRKVQVDEDGNAYVVQKDTTYTFDGTYNASTNKAATVSTVTNAINALDGGTIGEGSASKTITALSQSNGNVSATFGDISITKSQVSDFPTSMPASDVSSWAKASSKPTYTASEVGAIATSLKGANNGVAELDANGKVPSSQLPSYMDDVLEYAGQESFPTTGQSGIVYVDTLTNQTYRWSGTEYVIIGNSLALGETSSTAYRGDRGKIAYDHSQSTHAPTTSKSAASGGTDLSLVTTGEKYTWNNKTSLTIGTTSTTAAAGNHTHTASLATDTGTSAITLASAGKYKLTAGGSSVIFTMPTIPSYSSKTAESGGTDVSLVTTGEKYTWNNKSDLSLGTTATTAAKGNHTHTATLAADTGTSSITLASAGKYKLTAGGSSVIFTMPTSTNLSIGTTSTTAAAGNHTHTTSLASDSGTATVTLAANTTYKLTAGGKSVIFKTPVDNNTTYSSKSAASGGTDVSLVTTGEKYTWNNKSSLALGTTSSTAFRGDYGNTAYTHSQSTHAPTTSKSAASGGTDLSLVTTGEKYTWNNKSSLTIGTTSTTAAAGNHTHTTSLAADSGTASVTLSANTTYKLTAGGTSVIFKTPADSNSVTSVVGQTGAVTTAQIATALTSAGYKLTDNNTTYSGATQTTLGLVRIWASGDTLNINTAAS
jgi:hypothetical protein